MEHMGIEPDRLHYSWISSAESTKFVDVAKTVTEAVQSLGPNMMFVKKAAQAVKAEESTVWHDRVLIMISLQII